jgi:hypothetical protein
MAHLHPQIFLTNTTRSVHPISGRRTINATCLDFFSKAQGQNFVQQGVDKAQIVFNWQEVTKSLLHSFSGRVSQEALERQLRNIKFFPLGAEAFYFAISNILDKISIVDPPGAYKNTSTFYQQKLPVHLPVPFQKMS